MISVATVEQLRHAIERLRATPATPNPNELLRIMDGIITALEQIAEDQSRSQRITEKCCPPKKPKSGLSGRAT